MSRWLLIVWKLHYCSWAVTMLQLHPKWSVMNVIEALQHAWLVSTRSAPVLQEGWAVCRRDCRPDIGNVRWTCCAELDLFGPLIVVPIEYDFLDFYVMQCHIKVWVDHFQKAYYGFSSRPYSELNRPEQHRDPEEMFPSIWTSTAYSHFAFIRWRNVRFVTDLFFLHSLHMVLIRIWYKVKIYPSKQPAQKTSSVFYFISRHT